MGVLADFHVLDKDGIERLRRGESLKAAIELKRLTLVELGSLESILTECSFESTLDRYQSLECEGGSDAVITLVSEDLVAALAEMPDEDLSKVAKRWGATEELNCSGAEMKPVLRKLIALAKTVEPPKRLVLWNSP